MQLNMIIKLQLALTISFLLPPTVYTETILYIPVPPEYLGGFAAVPVVDRGVVAAANFAVNTHSTTLKDIVTARQQLVAGKTYDLCLQVKDKTAGAPHLVRTKIFKPFGKTYQLKTWTRVNNCTFND